MKRLKINPGTIYLANADCKGPSYAAADALEDGYQFFIYNSELYIIAGWRDAPRYDYFKLDVERNDVDDLAGDIANEVKDNGTSRL